MGGETREGVTTMFKPVQDVPLSLASLQEEMNRLFERLWHAGVSTPPFDGQPWGPVVDTYEFDDRYVFHVELPGLGAEEVSISYLDGSLTIQGEKNQPAEMEEARRTLRRERRFGAFRRTLEIPGEVDADRISARCRRGVLEIVVPKARGDQPRTIKVESADAE